MRGLRAAGIVGAASLLVIGGSSLRTGKPVDAPSAAPVEPVRDGTYTIGKDIRAGKWHTDGPRTISAVGMQLSAKCVWRIGWPELDHGVQEMAEIIRRDNSGATDVVLGPTGAVFETKGCKGWRPR